MEKEFGSGSIETCSPREKVEELEKIKKSILRVVDAVDTQGREP